MGLWIFIHKMKLCKVGANQNLNIDGQTDGNVHNNNNNNDTNMYRQWPLTYVIDFAANHNLFYVVHITYYGSETRNTVCTILYAEHTSLT